LAQKDSYGFLSPSICKSGLEFLLALDVANTGKPSKAIHESNQVADIVGIDHELDNSFCLGAGFGFDGADIGSII
jgi:hypothetical protein